MRLLLASKSPARRQTLVNAGVTPLVRVSQVDEEAVLAALPGGRAFGGGDTTAATEVSALAQAKCEAVAHDICAGRLEFCDGLPGGEELLVVGCDSMLEIDGQMVGKPRTPQVARQRIRAMRNTSATLWTGHHVILLSRAEPDGTRSIRAQENDSASTIVHFGDMDDAEIDAYVDSGEPLHVAGSFTIDALGGPFVTGIEGDHHSVVGISLPLLRQMTRRMGVFWPDLWDHRRH